eukprot:3879514-Prorocentrum_lima.AAC.1
MNARWTFFSQVAPLTVSRGKSSSVCSRLLSMPRIEVELEVGLSFGHGNVRDRPSLRTHTM